MRQLQRQYRLSRADLRAADVLGFMAIRENNSKYCDCHVKGWLDAWTEYGIRLYPSLNP